MEDMCMKNMQKIEHLTAQLEGTIKRLDKNDILTDGIHDLAKQVGLVATKLEIFAEKQSTDAEAIKAGIQLQNEDTRRGFERQGVRMGAIEKELEHYKSLEETVKNNTKELALIKNEPATFWKNLKWLAVVGVVSAIIGAVMGRVLNLFGY
jgi:hypothetical protein